MGIIAEKNKQSWNTGAAAYSALLHSEKYLAPILKEPAKAFHHSTWKLIQKYVPDLRGKKICIPSSGDNHAVFAFAMLGAKVTSCDISENQLANAEKIARRYEWGQSIEFICADTMVLEGIADNSYDFVYTSNGVHVWINDLHGMYYHIHRILKKEGVYIMYDIHPFLRPFDDDLKVKKTYDNTGPFEANGEITFAWRVMDIMNAIIDANLCICHMEEMFAEKDYDWPFWISQQEIENGVKIAPEEVDAMHDWRNNPIMALPSWISLVAKK